jgi:hypothetical protein
MYRTTESNRATTTAAPLDQPPPLSVDCTAEIATVAGLDGWSSAYAGLGSLVAPARYDAIAKKAGAATQIAARLARDFATHAKANKSAAKAAGILRTIASLLSRGTAAVRRLANYSHSLAAKEAQTVKQAAAAQSTLNQCLAGG